MSKPTNTPAATVKTPTLCACGCKLSVAPKRTWLPGHDARAAGVAARAAFAGDTTLIEALPGEKLQLKARALADKWTAAAAEKATRAAERAAAKATA